MEVICPKCGSIVGISETDGKAITGLHCDNCGDILLRDEKRPGGPALVISIILGEGRIKLYCPECGAGYVVERAKLPDGKVKTTCKKCGCVFSFVANLNKPMQLRPSDEKDKSALESIATSIPDPFAEKTITDDIPPLRIEPPPKTEIDEDVEPAYDFSLTGIIPGKAKEPGEETSYGFIDEDGNVNGPLDIIVLRNWVRSGQIKRDYIILLPDGKRKTAGSVPELMQTFRAVSEKDVFPVKPMQLAAPEKEFLYGIASGALAGAVFGVGLSLLTLVFGLKVLPVINEGGGSISFRGMLMLIVVTTVLGFIIGLLISLTHSINISNNTGKDVWTSDNTGLIGALLGGALGLIFLISGNAGILGSIGTVLVMYLLARTIILFHNRLFRAG